MSKNKELAVRANRRCGYPIDRPVSKYQMFNQWYVDNKPYTWLLSGTIGMGVGFGLLYVVYKLFIT